MHQAQAQVRALALRDLAAAWQALLDVGDLRGSLPNLIDALHVITERWGDVAAAVAAEFYVEVREAANLPVDFSPAALPAATPDQVEESIKWATKGLWSTSPDVPAALTLTEGVVSNLSLAPGRETILQAVKDDKKALGWARVTDGHPCAFCSMLASRGPVYKTAASAGFQAHDHEMCTPVPFFSQDDATLLYSQQLYTDWQHVTAGKGGNNALRAWRKWWDDGGSTHFSAA